MPLPFSNGYATRSAAPILYVLFVYSPPWPSGNLRGLQIDLQTKRKPFTKGGVSLGDDLEDMGSTALDGTTEESH